MLKLPQNVRLHKSGLYEARRSYQKTSYNAYGTSPQEALANLEAKLIAQLGKPKPAEWDFLSFWDQSYLPTIAGRSDRWKEQVQWAKNHLKPFWDTSLPELTRADFQHFINRSKLGATSKTHIRKIFFAVCKLAVIDGLIPSNPAQYITIPKPRKTKEKEYPTIPELQILVRNSQGLAALPIVIFCGIMGLRIGELHGLKPEHFRKKGILIVPGTKTDDSFRELPLPKPVLDAVKDCRFPLCAASRSSARQALHRVDATIHPHDLRHAANTALQELGCPPEFRRRILGHKEPGIQGKYSHSQQIALMRPYLEQLAEQVLTEVYVRVG